ncbi:MAG: tetratricopeptide repeat protein, partial [Candidatus Poribacteria bacterium]
MLIRKIIITFYLVALFLGCAKFQPKPLENKPKQQLPIPTIEEIKPQEPTKKITPKMIEEYALIHQISDMKVAEFYLTHPDYAKTNPYIPSSEDIAYYESKFLEKIYPNFRKEVEKDGFEKARSRYMNLDPNRDSGDKDSKITVEKINKINETVDKELNSAMDLYEKGLIDEAIEKMRSVVANKPESPTYIYNLGVIYLKKEDVRNAMACFQKTIELLEESSYTGINKIVYPRVYMGACINLGMIYNYLGLYNEAIDILTRAIKFSPKDYDANWNLAVTYYTMNDYNSA